MNHDDGNLLEDIKKSDIILLGVSRTSKTPTSIYLANRGYKTSNIPLVNKNSVPYILKKNPKLTCVVGLTTEPKRLVDIRRNRMTALKETEITTYTNYEKIAKEVEEAKKLFKKYIGQQSIKRFCNRISYDLKLLWKLYIIILE